MRLIKRPIVLLAAFLFGAVSFLSPSERASGQTPTPSAEQIDLFKNMSPDQQDAILKQMGGGGVGGLGSQSSGDRQSSNDRQGQDNSQDRNQRSRPDGDEAEPLIPVLKADDAVVIEIDWRLPPRPVSQSMQALYANQGISAGQNAQAAQAAALAAAGGAGGVNGLTGPAGTAASGGASTNYATGVIQASGTDSQLTEDDRKRLQDLMELIRSKNPYQLGRDGSLTLPGFPAIPLLGLTEDQSTLRLKVEPAFRDVDIRLTRLPLKKTGPDALKPFGYDLFDRAPSTFAPVNNVPVPSDYVIGPGDELNVQLFGNQNRSLRLVVGRDGHINFPELGPINVGGQLFNTVKTTVEGRVERQMIGVRASVSMGDTRSIRVFVLGEAKRPGSYTISGLGTISSALFAAGGIKPIGSLRQIQLKRQGTVVRRLDLYDLLIRGDTTDDTKLLQGDVIFIPPVGPTVSLDGEVRRPAIYEIKSESTIADVVQLAGGLTSEADTSKAMLTRIDEQQHRVVMAIDLSSRAKAQGVRNGDLLRVSRLRPTLDSGVLIQGHVYTPGAFAYSQGMHLSDVIHSVDELRPNADLHYVLIRRELPPNRRIAVVSADLAEALKSPGSKADLELLPRDRIMVFDLASGRDRFIQPVLDELRLQSNTERPTEVVHVDGRVKVPGAYPLEPGMTVADLIRAGGGLSDAAYRGEAELTRYSVGGGESRSTQLVDIDLGAALNGEAQANIKLQPFDNLSIKEVPEWRSLESVSLVGEVRFPGRYSVKRGETLKSVLARAGGLTDFAFPEGSVFLREELKRHEQEQLDMLATRMQTDLAVLALQGAAANQAGAASALAVGQSLMGQIRATKAVGRLVIDLPRMMRQPTGSPMDVILRNGDELVVPKFQQQVTVIGEVQSATSHLYSPELSRDDYISLSGGATNRADRGKIYVVRANGSVVANAGNRWFQAGHNMEIKPGDTVVVPLDTEKMPALPFWTAVTTIIYNVAIAAAAVHSF